MFFKYIDYQTNVWYSLVMNGWWNIKLEDIKGLGPKNIKLLNKLNILNMDDLINYYPYRFNVYERSDINTLNQDDKLDFEEESLEAYNYTLNEFENPKTNEKSNH